MTDIVKMKPDSTLRSPHQVEEASLLSWMPPLLITQVCNSILSASFLTNSNSASYKLFSLAKPRIHFYLSAEPEEGKNSLCYYRQQTAWSRISTTGSFLTWPSKGSKHCLKKTATLGTTRKPHTTKKRSLQNLFSH